MEAWHQLIGGLAGSRHHDDLMSVRAQGAGGIPHVCLTAAGICAGGSRAQHYAHRISPPGNEAHVYVESRRKRLQHAGVRPLCPRY